MTEREREWIDEQMGWFSTELGDAALRNDVVVPEVAFFPDGYAGSEQDVRALVERVCGHMGVDPGLVRVEFYMEGAPTDNLGNLPAHAGTSSGTAGHYRKRDGKMIMAIESPEARNPVALAATIAHELGHERLLGEGRIDRERQDGEPLTDLLTVYLGMGIFTANAAFQFSAKSGHGWRMQRLGYMTEQMYGYALARYARSSHGPM